MISFYLFKSCPNCPLLYLYIFGMSAPESQWISGQMKEDWARVSNWITAICVIRFDLNIGQTAEACFPAQALNKDDLTTVCNLAFPDSNSSSVGDCVYSFRFRKANSDILGKNTKESPDGESNILKLLSNLHAYHFGYVFFRQRPDSTISRGYFQKSIVIVSPFPFVELFERAIAVIGPMFFEFNGSLTVLETAVNNMSKWPEPLDCMSGNLVSPTLDKFDPKKVATSGLKSHELPLLGSVLKFCFDRAIESPLAKLALPDGRASKRLKLRIDMERELRGSLKKIDLFGSFKHVNLYRRFRGVVGNLWYLWEIALTGQPLMIFGPNAVACTRAVFGVLSLISPIPYRGDFRPYFTVFDPDFKHFEDMYDHNSLPSVILGITNPFLLKRFENFPNILILAESKFSNNDKEKRKDDIFSFGIPLLKRKSSKEENISTDMKNHGFFNPTGSHRMISKAKPLVCPSKFILKRLLDEKNVYKYDDNGKLSKLRLSDEYEVDGDLSMYETRSNHSPGIHDLKEITNINNTVLRNHFYELTTRFMAPLEFFFKAHWPRSSGDLSEKADKRKGFKFNPFTESPKFPKFVESKFLEKIKELSLSEIEKHFSFRNEPRSSLVGLYERFFQSPHFPIWFSCRREESMLKVDREIEKYIKVLDMKQMLTGILLSEAKLTSDGIACYLQKILNDPLKSKSSSGKELIACLQSHLSVVSRAIEDTLGSMDAMSDETRDDRIFLCTKSFENFKRAPTH